MPTLQQVIMSVRRLVENDKDYLRGEHRTKYVLIDPLLRALGWNTGDPAQVKLEFETGKSTKRADYALFKRGYENPVGLVEAKLLPIEKILEFKKFAKQRNSRTSADFNRLKWSDTSAWPKMTLFNPDEWAALKKANEGQLEEYVQELRLKAGYAILTNGDEWWIYDLEKYGLGNGVSEFADSMTAETSILTADAKEAAEVLSFIQSKRKWPGL